MGMSGFGIIFVRGLNLVPKPAARIMAFMGLFSSLKL
jgi:hypothetical protein